MNRSSGLVLSHSSTTEMWFHIVGMILRAAGDELPTIGSWDTIYTTPSTDTPIPSEPAFRTVVNADGTNALFSSGMAQVPGAFNSLLKIMNQEINFVFFSPQALRKFAELWSRNYGDREDIPNPRIELHIFAEERFRFLEDLNRGERTFQEQRILFLHVYEWQQVLDEYPLLGRRSGAYMMLHRPCLSTRQLHLDYSPLRGDGRRFVLKINTPLWRRSMLDLDFDFRMVFIKDALDGRSIEFVDHD